jgi:callose synthase
VDCSSEEELKGRDNLDEELRLWASYRGQTLTRTGTYSVPLSLFLFYSLISRLTITLPLAVRGMMYYRHALELQAFLDMAGDEGDYSL